MVSAIDHHISSIYLVDKIVRTKRGKSLRKCLPLGEILGLALDNSDTFIAALAIYEYIMNIEWNLDSFVMCLHLINDLYMQIYFVYLHILAKIKQLTKHR